MYLEQREQGLDPTIAAEAGGADQGTMMNLSPEILAIFKRLQKKDPVTKIKAFQELDKHIEAISAEDDEYQNVLTFFLYHFCRVLANEADRQVRESAHQTFSKFLKKDRRKLAPHIKKIFSLWFCSFYDVSQEVCQIARANFEFAFPENKRDQVFKLAYKNFLHFAAEQLKQSEDSMAEASVDLTKKQKEEIYDRVLSGVFSALAEAFQYMQSWDQESKDAYLRKLSDLLGIESKEKEESAASKKKTTEAFVWSFLKG